MPVRTGSIREVKQHPKFPLRYDVWLHEQAGPGPNTPLFTREEQYRNWIANFCESAKEQGRRVMVWTMDTQFGERIVKVDWEPERTEAA
jgi:hypothetical protein